MLNKRKLLAVSAAPLALVAGPASAEIPAEATAAFEQLVTDGAAMVAAGWPIVVAVVVGTLLIKLFKKVTSRAT